MTPHELRIALGKEPAPLPEPFAGMIRQHLKSRPNLRTTGGSLETPWLFPGARAGKHVGPQSIMKRLRQLGINLLGAQGRASFDLGVLDPPRGHQSISRSRQSNKVPAGQRRLGPQICHRD
ncbi:MAG: hypothetical protein JWP74_3986 [Marmoricola sp.]|nr:hypothetical protein [Marmoricola sp.]